MQYTMGVEEIERGRWLGWVFELPGCTVPAASVDEAKAHAPDYAVAYVAWQASHGETLGPLFDSAPIEVKVTEVLRAPPGGDGLGNSRAFFDDDRLPLKSDEVDEALGTLSHTRQELLALIRPLRAETLEAPIAGEVRGSIASILEHLAWAEWWYCDRLGIAFNREEMPDDPRAKLDHVRAWTRARLRELVGERRIFDQIGEQWSARKLVRRTVWHELDHITHISQLLTGQAGGAGRYVEL